VWVTERVENSLRERPLESAYSIRWVESLGAVYCSGVTVRRYEPAVERVERGRLKQPLSGTPRSGMRRLHGALLGLPAISRLLSVSRDPSNTQSGATCALPSSTSGESILSGPADRLSRTTCTRLKGRGCMLVQRKLASPHVLPGAHKLKVGTRWVHARRDTGAERWGRERAGRCLRSTT